MVNLVDNLAVRQEGKKVTTTKVVVPLSKPKPQQTSRTLEEIKLWWVLGLLKRGIKLDRHK